MFLTAPDPSEGEVGTPARQADRWSPLAVGLVCGLIVFAWLVLANQELIGAPIIEDGDQAANSILVDRAEDLRLLVGNYSRLGFNHPGPALLYVQAAGDVIFHRLLGIVPGSYNGQFLGILALNAFCIGASCAVIRRVTGRTIAAFALLALVPILNVWEPYAIATTWMPGVYIAPFLLLVVAATSVAGSRWGHLWLLITAGALCVHGHVAFVLFAGATTLAALLAGGLRARRSGRWPTRTDLVLATVVFLVFLAPIAADLILHWPGEFGKYLRYAGSDVEMDPRTAADVLGFTLSFWTRSGSWLLVLLALAVALAILARLVQPADTGARFRLDLIVMCGLEAALFAFYAARGVDHLEFDYVGWFMLACPLLVLWAGLDTMLDWLDRRPAPAGRVVGAVGCAGVAIALVLVGQSSNPTRGMAPALAAALPREPVRLVFDTPAWQAALGLIEDARRREQPVCVVNRRWKVSVTPALICKDDTGRLVEVLGPGEPRTGKTIYDDGVNALVVD